MKNLTAVLVLLGSLLVSVGAFAAESALSVPQTATEASSPSPSNVSSTTAGVPAKPSLLDQFTAGYFAVYHGASLNDPTSNFTLDHNGLRNTSNATYLDSVADLTFMVTPTVGVGAYVPFFIVPMPGQHFVIGDVGPQIYDRITLSPGLRLFTNLIVQSSTSDYSQARKQSVAIKTTPYLTYEIPHSSFTVGTYTEVKSYLDVTSSKTFKLWAMPFARYSLSESVALNLAYEMEADHMFGKPSLDFTSYQTDLQPGVVWKITRKIMLNPYIQIFTGGAITADAMAFGAVLNARMF